MHRRLAGLALAASLPVAGLIMAAVPAASAQAAAHPPAAARAASIARSYIQHLKIGQPESDHRVSVHKTDVSGLSDVTSTNWSGYADTGSSFSKVSGSWTEPTITCTSTTSLAAFWVGIDGYSSSSVEQDGTLVECYGDVAYQYSWWEMYPTNDIQVVGESVASGDSISASVVRSGTSYTLKVTDSTHTANSFTKTETCSSCKNSSAEWIAEAPSGSSGVYPLSDFHTWTESGASVTKGSTTGVISSFTDDKINMVNSSGQIKASTGALTSSGKGFTVTWKRSS